MWYHLTSNTRVWSVNKRMSELSMHKNLWWTCLPLSHHFTRYQHKPIWMWQQCLSIIRSLSSQANLPCSWRWRHGNSVCRTSGPSWCRRSSWGCLHPDMRRRCCWWRAHIWLSETHSNPLVTITTSHSGLGVYPYIIANKELWIVSIVTPD